MRLLKFKSSTAVQNAFPQSLDVLTIFREFRALDGSNQAQIPHNVTFRFQKLLGISDLELQDLLSFDTKSVYFSSLFAFCDQDAACHDVSFFPTISRFLLHFLDQNQLLLNDIYRNFNQMSTKSVLNRAQFDRLCEFYDIPSPFVMSQKHVAFRDDGVCDFVEFVNFLNHAPIRGGRALKVCIANFVSKFNFQCCSFHQR